MKDEKLEEVIDLILLERMARVSLVQKRLMLGYNRVMRIFNQLEMIGFITGSKGSKPREILIRDKSKLRWEGLEADDQ